MYFYFDQEVRWNSHCVSTQPPDLKSTSMVWDAHRVKEKHVLLGTPSRLLENHSRWLRHKAHWGNTKNMQSCHQSKDGYFEEHRIFHVLLLCLLHQMHVYWLGATDVSPFSFCNVSVWGRHCAHMLHVFPILPCSVSSWAWSFRAFFRLEPLTLRVSRSHWMPLWMIFITISYRSCC